MKHEVKHHIFTLSVQPIGDDEQWFPVREFDEHDSFDDVCLTILHLEEMGLFTSLSCEVYSTYEEDVKID